MTKWPHFDGSLIHEAGFVGKCCHLHPILKTSLLHYATKMLLDGSGTKIKLSTDLRIRKTGCNELQLAE